MRPKVLTKEFRFVVYAMMAFAFLNDANSTELTIPQAHGLDDVRAKRLPLDEQNKIAELEQPVRLHPADAPILVRTAILSGSVKPITFTGIAIGAALNALGDSIDSVSVGRLVNAAGKARPEAILEIVRIAIRETPRRLHRDVVAAAVTAVPDAFAHVCAHRVESEDLAGSAGGDDPIGYEPCQDTELTLAESILDVAVHSGSDSYADLSSALNDTLIALSPQPPDNPILDPPGPIPPVSP
jgi:hypothetical protein